MPAIPLDVLVEAVTALDRARNDPSITIDAMLLCTMVAGKLGHHVRVILEAQQVEVQLPDLPATPESVEPDWHLLLADLQHAVRWHDQLTPGDIARFKATIAKVFPNGPAV